VPLQCKPKIKSLIPLNVCLSTSPHIFLCSRTYTKWEKEAFYTLGEDSSRRVPVSYTVHTVQVILWLYGSWTKSCWERILTPTNLSNILPLHTLLLLLHCCTGVALYSTAITAMKYFTSEGEIHLNERQLSVPLTSTIELSISSYLQNKVTISKCPLLLLISYVKILMDELIVTNRCKWYKIVQVSSTSD